MNRFTTIATAAVAVSFLTTTADVPTRAAGGDAADSVTSVQSFADPDTQLGESTLRRTADGVLATFDSTQVTPGHAVTLWWVVFNQPQNCSAPGCGPDDIFVGGDPVAGLDTDAIANADIVAGYAAGTIAGADGTVSMASRLTTGEPGAGIIFGDGALLEDAGAAEIHLVARTHGPAIDGATVDQTTSFEGGCEVFLNPPDLAEAEGECVDLQYTVHQP